jgi:hypothetical protein
MPFSLLAFGLGTRSTGAKYRAPGRRAHAWWEEVRARQNGNQRNMAGGWSLLTIGPCC